MSAKFCLRSVFAFFLAVVFLPLPSCAQTKTTTSITAFATGTVSINAQPEYTAVPSQAQACLWYNGYEDVAYSIPCTTPVLNICYCPTSASAASAAITDCMFAWYSDVAPLQIPSAISAYNTYCGQVLADVTGTPTPTSTSKSSGSSGGSSISSGAIVGIVIGCVLVVIIITFALLYSFNEHFRKIVNGWYNSQKGKPDTDANPTAPPTDPQTQMQQTDQDGGI